MEEMRSNDLSYISSIKIRNFKDKFLLVVFWDLVWDLI